jgi:hypothetical protein
MAISLFNGYKVTGAGEFGVVVMTKAVRRLNKFWSLLTIVVLSSATMIWLLWHYPLGTGIATLAVLTAFAVLIRLTRAIDTDSMSGAGTPGTR